MKQWEIDYIKERVAPLVKELDKKRPDLGKVADSIRKLAHDTESEMGL